MSLQNELLEGGSSMSIGGPLDYARLAQAHRPTDPQALRAEVRRLATTGLTATDISVALRINIAHVREMLAATGEEAAQLHREAWRA